MAIRVLPTLPAELDEPMVYLSDRQATACLKEPLLAPLVDSLPCWVSQRFIGVALRKDGHGIDRALAAVGRAFVWATEFENVHSMWKFDEPQLKIDGKTYRCSESYYHACKPRPFDEVAWAAQREGVMRRAVRAKLEASPEVCHLLVSTHPHPLLSIKDDDVWGFHPSRGGQNLLARVYEDFRAELVAASSAPAPPAAPSLGSQFHAFPMADPRPSPAASAVGVIGFYWPGKDTPCDRACGARFLGNFWLSEQTFAPPGQEPVRFQCAEGAFQACKFWGSAQHFGMLGGDESFQLKRTLPSPDFSYAGHGSNWSAMIAVLKSKFTPGSSMAGLLLATGDAFLLEHNQRAGRDQVWSDNFNGEGTNWLGLQLMLLRDALREHAGMATVWKAWCAGCVDMDTGVPIGDAWQCAVRAAAKVMP